MSRRPERYLVSGLGGWYPGCARRPQRCRAVLLQRDYAGCLVVWRAGTDSSHPRRSTPSQATGLSSAGALEDPPAYVQISSYLCSEAFLELKHQARSDSPRLGVSPHCAWCWSCPEVHRQSWTVSVCKTESDSSPDFEMPWQHSPS